MRNRLLIGALVIIVAVLAFVGFRAFSPHDAALVVPAASPTPLEATSPPDADASPDATDASPAASDTPAPTDSPAPSATPTIAPQPTGLAPGWDQPYERKAGGREADLLVRTGDINNLGYGWPAHFTPFSGRSTPPHPYPCTPRLGSPDGTDRIMLGTAVTASDIQKRGGDGYSNCSTRPDNLPRPISLDVGALPSKVHVVLVQMFLDDFQAPVWHSHFQVSLNGTRIPTFEDTIDALEQTGPIGKLVTLRLLPEYVPLLRSGTVKLYIDDPTTHAPDGYAVDFVRILVNPHAFQYAVTIACTVVDADTLQPISGATVTSAQVTGTTGSAGTSTLRGVPAGMASINASAVGYDSAVQLLDLPVGTPGVARFELHRHREGVADLRRLIARDGSVAIYGIHFDTASAQLRPDSITSLETLLELVKGLPGSHWIIAGHTDNQGGAAYNLNLSEDRAKSVITWLGAHGVEANRFTAQGFGATHPVADNATENGRALNRRVEVRPVK